MRFVGERVTASGTWTGQAGVTSITINLVGGGGGGGGCPANSLQGTGGGGAGEFGTMIQLMIDSGEVIPVTIGAAGAGSTTTGGTGGDTTFGPGNHFAAITVKGGIGSITGGSSASGGGRLGGAGTGAGASTGRGGASDYEYPNFGGGAAGGRYRNSGDTPPSLPGSTLGWNLWYPTYTSSNAFNPSGGAGGGYGAPSPWGIGGIGGDGATAAPANTSGSPGANAPTTSYGAGGGGAGGGTGTHPAQTGGNGCPGVVDIFYFITP